MFLTDSNVPLIILVFTSLNVLRAGFGDVSSLPSPVYFYVSLRFTLRTKKKRLKKMLIFDNFN